MDTQYWIEFLFKKIDQLNKKDTISGLTNWGIIIALAAIGRTVYSILENYSVIDNFNKLSFLWTLTGVLLLFIYFTYLNLTIKKKNLTQTLLIPLYAPYSLELLIYFCLIYAVLIAGFIKNIMELQIFYKSFAIILLCMPLLSILVILFLIKFEIPISFELINISQNNKFNILRKGRKLIIKAQYVLFKTINLVCNPIIILLSALVFLFFVANSNSSLRPITNFKDEIVIVVLTWIFIILIGVLVMRRRSCFLLDSLVLLQNEIMLGKLNNIDEIKESYENIVVGQTMSRWIRDYFMQYMGKNKQMSQIMSEAEERYTKIQALRQEIKCDWKYSDNDKCKECRKELDSVSGLLDSAKFLSREINKMTKRLELIIGIYLSSAVAEQISKELKKANEEIKKYVEITDRVHLTVHNAKTYHKE